MATIGLLCGGFLRRFGCVTVYPGPAALLFCCDASPLKHLRCDGALCDRGRPCDGEFAEAAVPKPAAHHDAPGLLPSLGLEKSASDVGELLRELLDGALHDRRSLCIVSDQDGVENLFADVFGRLLAERIFAGFA
jgi:hypothetical protein